MEKKKFSMIGLHSESEIHIKKGKLLHKRKTTGDNVLKGPFIWVTKNTVSIKQHFVESYKKTKYAAGSRAAKRYFSLSKGQIML